MVLKLVGVSKFTHTQIPAMALLEKKVPFDFKEIDYWGGEQKRPEITDIQPFARVPLIDDEGFILYESRAIARYIDAKYPDQGPRLVPTGLKENALFEQAASVELNDFHPYAMTIVHEFLIKRALGQESDANVVKTNLEKLDKTLSVYEIILSKQKYLVGEEITLADLFHIPYGSLLAVAGIDIMTSKPNVARWFQDITGRSSWQAVKDGFESNLSY